MPRGGWISTHMGERFYPLDPDPDQIQLGDILHGLSQLCRFNGQCHRFYSVAEHCCHLHDSMAEVEEDLETAPLTALRAWALLHDAAEAYIGDMVRPLKRGELGFAQQYREAEEEILKVVIRRFALNVPEEVAKIVSQYDARLLVTEGEQVFARGPAAWVSDPPWAAVPRLRRRVQFWSPPVARYELARRVNLLRKKGLCILSGDLEPAVVEMSYAELCGAAIRSCGSLHDIRGAVLSSPNLLREYLLSRKILYGEAPE